MADLNELRTRIDELDAKLVDLLNERAKVVEDIGAAKRKDGGPVYAPDRENRVLKRVRDLNEGPLPDLTMEAIWRELMSGSFALERPLTIAHLGPEGSFSHAAAARHFGSSVTFQNCATIEDVFRDVGSRTCDYGMVPWENSLVGGITDTHDAFVAADVPVCAETMIEVRHCALCMGELAHVTQVTSKPQVLDQCRRWIRAHLPEAEWVPSTSSADAVRHAATNPNLCAIGSAMASAIHGVPIRAEGIEDRPGNITRFLVLGHQHPEPTGNDRTSILFVTSHHPGALVDVLTCFRFNGINLAHIDKRPSGVSNWEYTFFADADAHRDDPPMARAIASAQKLCPQFRVLGSYPRAGQVLAPAGD
ncbi:MAG: chorismate mutase [Phycisphaerales bacterium]|nr:chorismate mutase [Phycisphaerales bacterium]